MRYPPMNPKCLHLLHGGDYNPDQWREAPQVWDEDFRLMDLAHCNAVSLGIFAWSALEPEEGRYEFGWLDDVMDRLAASGRFALLATPSGARPAWMSQRHPEVLRVDEARRRQLHGYRHNHCFTSPVYRERTQAMNRALALRYKDHPALLLWHVSNEYGGECHCPLCQDAFRAWLRARYHDDLDALNRAWWTSFWSHAYSDWSQVESPSSLGETLLHGLTLDWKRFVTHQTVDFFRSECVPLRDITPDVPVCVNLMGTYPGLDYRKLAPYADVVSWDSYPTWHAPEGDVAVGQRTAFLHDLNRSLKGGQPFLLMESTPSATNWQPVAKLKRPGMHLLSSLQAVAHGSDAVLYFQWRKSRGSSEKFHGAVVDHDGRDDTRVFRDVAEVGSVLGTLDGVVGTTVPAEAALVFDWENRWALEDAQGFNNERKEYEPTVLAYHRGFWRRGVPVDVIGEDDDLSRYRLVVAPMLYMVRPGLAERIEAFVSAGGTFVATYGSGLVDEHDLCFLGGFPGPLRPVLGIRIEETDGLYDADEGRVRRLDSGRTYAVRQWCDLIHAETAEVLAVYDEDFYKGRPALTLNRFGAGKAYFVAFRNNDDFEAEFLGGLVDELGIRPALDAALPDGVSVQVRTDGERDFLFVMNFTTEEKMIRIPPGFLPEDGREDADTSLRLGAYGTRIIERPRAIGTGPAAPTKT